MTKEELVKLQDEFCEIQGWTSMDGFSSKNIITRFSDFLLTKPIFKEEETVEPESKDSDLFDPFFFEYFLYHGYLSLDERETIKNVIRDFFSKNNKKFHTMLSYEIQKEVNDYWNTSSTFSSYDKEVYLALSAFVIYWKNKLLELENIDSEIADIKSRLIGCYPAASSVFSNSSKIWKNSWFSTHMCGCSTPKDEDLENE